MKISEFLDKTEDKIDYMFRRGKNADERTFDFFLRSVTFFLILIIVLSMWTFYAHADNSLPFAYGVDTSALINPLWWTFNDADSELFSNEYYGYHAIDWTKIPESGNDWVNNMPYFAEFDSANKYIVCDVCNIPSSSWVVNVCFDKSLFDEGHIIMLADNGFHYISDGTYTASYYTVNTSLQIYDRGTITINQGVSSWDLGGYNNNIFFANVPLYAGNQTYEGYETLVENNFADNLENLYNINYFCYPDLNLCNSALISNGGQSGLPPVESNKNHMYAELFNVFIEGPKSKKLYSNYDLLFDIQVDDWVVEHINDYKLNINYQFVFTGEYIKTYNVASSYSEVVNLRTIVNTPYKKSLFELFNEMKSDGKSVNSVLAEFSSASDNFLESTANTFIDKKIYSIFKNEFLFSVGMLHWDNHQSMVDINNSYLIVSCYLSAKGEESDFESQIYSKKFDFKNGTEDINSDGIMENPDPWVDPNNPNPPENETPSVNNSVNTGGGSIAYGYGGNSTNDIDITVGNGYQDTALHQLTREDIQRNHQKVIDYINHMRGVFEGIGDEIEDDVGNTHASGFIGFLQETYDWIPGVDYITEGIIIIVAIAIIAFIFKCIF